MIDKIKIRILGTFASGNNISNINQITNRSHQDLQGIGNKTHEQIESDITNINNALSAQSGDILNLENEISGLNTNLNGKVNISDIQDVLNSIETNKPLSANQGRVLKEAIDNINLLLASDEITLDTLQEIVDFIQQNKEILDTLAISNIAGLETALSSINAQISNLNLNKVNVSDVIDNLTSIETQKPLSANQGKELKTLIDNIPTGGSSAKSFETVYGLDKTIGSDINSNGYVYDKVNDNVYKLPTGATSTQTLNDIGDKIARRHYGVGITETSKSVDTTAQTGTYRNMFSFGNYFFITKGTNDLDIYDLDLNFIKRETLTYPLYSVSSYIIHYYNNSLYLITSGGTSIIRINKIDLTDINSIVNTQYDITATSPSALGTVSNFNAVDNYIIVGNGTTGGSTRIAIVDISSTPSLLTIYVGTNSNDCSILVSGGSINSTILFFNASTNISSFSQTNYYYSISTNTVILNNTTTVSNPTTVGTNIHNTYNFVLFYDFYLGLIRSGLMYVGPSVSFYPFPGILYKGANGYNSSNLTKIILFDTVNQGASIIQKRDNVAKFYNLRTLGGVFSTNGIIYTKNGNVIKKLNAGIIYNSYSDIEDNISEFFEKNLDYLDSCFN